MINLFHSYTEWTKTKMNHNAIKSELNKKWIMIKSENIDFAIQWFIFFQKSQAFWWQITKENML